MKNNDLVEFVENTEEFYKKISQNVKKLRQKNKYTQLDFSANIGFNSVSFYCDCENNKNGKHFNLIHLVRISKFLNIDINEILQ
ncbi:helix-turn-helix domain-containing protein [Aliarcobacter butzleri]|uniref:helix-turn-helix domain-containing protein n=1 Tax=Aliarcobacter butzleri TaxID=28197 RepID=UPI00125F98C5|nr:helix-turn-helix transcriptional regulator [Aliarcobacter butzleri]